MSIRNLDALFHPTSIALIGASTKPKSIGAVLASNMFTGGYEGPIMPVNPKAQSINGVLAYKDVASLPITPDMACIATPPASIPALIDELGARGTRAAVVITAGLRDMKAPDGQTLEYHMLAAAKKHGLRVAGPNCIGIISTPAGVNASFAEAKPLKGRVAFVAQSGALVATLLDWASTKGVGFSHLVSMGDQADADFGDMLDYMAQDPDTDAIVLYIEAAGHKNGFSPRKFISAARAVARIKPVIAIKAGRSAAAAKAASSHTGALAGADGVYDAVFNRCGILRARDLDEIFDAIETLSKPGRVTGDRLLIVTNGGGAGVMAVDKLSDLGGQLIDLPEDTLKKIDAVCPPTWSRGNPVDIIGDAPGKRFFDTMKICNEVPDVDGTVVLYCPTAVASSLEGAQAVVEAVKDTTRPIFTNWLGSSEETQKARTTFREGGIPTYETPEKAIRAFMHLAQFSRVQNLLMEVPPSKGENFVPDETKAKAIVDKAMKEKQLWLDAVSLSNLFECYQIPIARSAKADTPADVAAAQKKFGTPIVIKIMSPDITHKSDVGGVALNLETPEEAKAAAEAMLVKVEKKCPKARLEGFLVQEMIKRPRAYELICGVAVDNTFGPYLLFGQGGVSVEVVADSALALAPINTTLAMDMITHTRIYKQLKGFRDRPPAAINEVADVLVRVSKLICDFPEIQELDINPLLCDEKGVVSVDARIKLGEPKPGARDARLAIKPYPKELEAHESISGFGEYFVRPVRPEDYKAFTEFFGKLAPEDVRLRFFSPLRALPTSLLSRLTHIDYDRDMAFVMFDDKNQLVGTAHFSADPNKEKGEYAVIVRSDLKGHGMGTALMNRIVAYAKSYGVGEIYGDVLEENTMMLSLCRDLHFAIAPVPGSPGMVRASLKL
ncbi:MAG TPA: bifunctional acetate--CoA ligase family protein/GNAT family N-acetyltransferase [Rhizomicrobium sp.]|nr:bifunctional acetate--CoA ligase family protein/GNAT family N-acetyltransferase [Rhizomicrobium sp.]